MMEVLRWPGILEPLVVPGDLEPRPGGWLPSRPRGVSMVIDECPSAKIASGRKDQCVRISLVLLQVVSYPPEWCRPSFARIPHMMCDRKLQGMAQGGGAGNAAPLSLLEWRRKCPSLSPGEDGCGLALLSLLLRDGAVFAILAPVNAREASVGADQLAMDTHCGTS